MPEGHMAARTNLPRRMPVGFKPELEGPALRRQPRVLRWSIAQLPMTDISPTGFADAVPLRPAPA
jgi:hypothetical protein